MNTQHWSIRSIQLPLRYTWKISRNATDEKINLLVRITEHGKSGEGEAAPNVRYGESPAILLEQFETFRRYVQAPIRTIEELLHTFEELQLSYALRFAIESAWFHLHAGNSRTTLQRELNIPFRNAVPTSYTIPIMDPGAVEDFYREQQLHRFPFIKLKINAESADDLTRVTAAVCQQPLMLDANEAFTDVENCIRFLERIRKLPLELVEQPLPSRLVDEAIYMKKFSPFPLFADEAITHEADFGQLKQCFDGINMKLMKTGSYSNGLRILREAKAAGMRTMIGCMVETTLGISSALNLSGLADYVDLDSFLLLKDEPFVLVKEQNGILYFKDADKLCT